MSGYVRMNRIKRETGVPIKDLLVLANQNDPYYVGSPKQCQMAEWFANLWERYGYTTGVHVRRIHYRHVSQTNPRHFDGRPYENTEASWNAMVNASKYARYLGLVDPEALVDRRNPEPHIYMEPEELEEPSWEYYLPEWSLPEIEARLTVNLPIAEVNTTGYHYDDLLQPYHVEVWCEKSTMNSELQPVCRRYATNLITGLGEMSITSTVSLLRRIEQIGKPCRILYLSDFDPSGAQMPISAARHTEYLAQTYTPDADIKLTPLVLTAEQAREYDLPRTPIKDSDLKKKSFEQLQGEGATELDALEALHPGALARIVTEAVTRFRDGSLPRRLIQTSTEAEQRLEQAADDAIQPHLNRVEEIEQEAREIAETYQSRLEDLNDELQTELSPLRDELETLQQAIKDELDALEPDLPELPEPETPPEEGDGWLYDSNRRYLDQLDAYDRHKRGES